MHPLSPKELKSFQDEYLQSKRKQYVEFFRYIIIVVSSPLVAESCRALIELKFFLLLSLIIGGFVAGLVIYYIWNLKTNQEYGITAYFVAFCAFVLVVNYNDPTGYFIDPKNSFYFGYGICSCERQIMSKIPNMRLRIMFRLAIFVASFLVVTPNQISLFMMQSVHAISGIYFDLDDEKRDKKLFKAYFSSRDQLVQFKDFVVRDIPASILVVTPDLLKCLFSNDSFQQKFGKTNLKALLEQIKIEDNHNNNNDSTSLHSLSSQGNQPQQNFLQFLQSNITKKRLSCSLIYKNPETDEQHIFTAKVVQITWDDQHALAIILQDITEQHTILTLKAADAQKDALVATVSHELRTPLNGMLGMIQILQQRITDKQLLHYVNICKNSGNLLAALVNSILDLNQIRASTIRLYPEKVNLKELLTDIVHLFEVQCAQKNIYLHFKLPETPSLTIHTDRNRLSQILINLIGNALKFTSKGGITLLVNQPKEYLRHLEFKVIDTGLGIKLEDQEKLFKMFGKLEQTDRKVNREGIGLGLTISNNLAKLLCDNNPDLSGIKVESKHGQGSCFTWLIKKNLLTETPSINSPKSPKRPENISHKIHTYQFPQIKTFSETESCNISLVRCKTSPDQEHSLLLSSPISQKNSVVVLIVDDNPLNLTVAEYLVSAKGYKVKTALSGTEAIKALLQNNLNVQLIFMDLQMPEMDGYETARNIEKLIQEGKISKIPIIALTANDSHKERNACVKAGMKDYLSKPLRDKELSTILNTYLI